MTEYLYASEMWRASNCPGSVRLVRRLQRSGERGETAEGKYGRDLHSLTEDVVNGKIEAESIADEKQRLAVLRCIEFLKGRAVMGETEKPLYILVRGALIASCRADLISVSEGVVTIPDWKFYRAPLEAEEWQWQALTMQVAALQEHKECHVAVAVAYLPIMKLTYEHRLDRSMLDEAALQIYNVYQRANAEEPSFQAGPWCVRCRALSTCPAAQESMMDLCRITGFDEVRRDDGALPKVAVIKRRVYSEVEQWSRGRFLGYLEALPFLQPLAEAMKDRLRRELVAGKAHTHWGLKDVRNPREGTVKAVKAALGDHLSPEELDACCKPQFGLVQDALRSKGLSPDEIYELLRPFERGWKKALERRAYDR